MHQNAAFVEIFNMIQNQGNCMLARETDAIRQRRRVPAAEYHRRQIDGQLIDQPALEQFKIEYATALNQKLIDAIPGEFIEHGFQVHGFARMDDHLNASGFEALDLGGTGL
jgi:hypothetical protein